MVFTIPIWSRLNFHFLDEPLLNCIIFPTGHSAGCGINEEISQWMDRIQNSGIDEDTVSPPVTTASPKFKKHKKAPADGSRAKKTTPESTNFEDPLNKYSREANDVNYSRHKRATKREDSKNTCSLYIQTDPLIWRHIREGFPEVSTLCFPLQSTYALSELRINYLIVSQLLLIGLRSI